MWDKEDRVIKQKAAGYMIGSQRPMVGTVGMMLEYGMEKR